MSIGMGTRVLLIMLMFQIFLSFTYPDMFSTTDIVSDIFNSETGVNITDDGIDYNNDDVTESTEELLGTASTEGGSWWSATTNFINNVILGAVNFVRFLMEFITLPFRIINRLTNLPYEFKILFGVFFYVPYIIAIFQAWTGRNF